MEEILDSEPLKNNTYSFDLKEMGVLFLAILVSLSSLVLLGIYTNVIVFILGCFICMLLAYFKKTIWYYIFLGLLLLTVTRFVSITSFEFTMGFNSVSLNFFTTFFTVLHIALNRRNILFKKTSDGRASTVKGFGKSKEEEQSDYNSLVNRFTKKYKNKSSQELQDIIDNPKMVTEAKEAASALLGERD